jgi:hypothetical protein
MRYITLTPSYLTIKLKWFMIVIYAGLAHLGRAEVFQTSGEGIMAPAPLELLIVHNPE